MRGAKELCLEEYVRFFNKEGLVLTLNQLKKIARINGLVKVHQINKSRVLDALRSVELTPPGRSTVGERMLKSSTNEELSLDEVLEDIASLGWQECPIVSILTVGNECAMEAGEGAAPISFSYCADQVKKKGGKCIETTSSGAQRKRKSVTNLTKLPLIGTVRAEGCPSGSQV
ncbi:hypothetical protein KFK09_028281 [Dendrobium nobile]|uniref:DUF7787 domain-containing protein n=1 Tax=Dendrobium nobile TaxID=94219 RepID=A0A8T3A349_DENNO|nr:hypothetical protein KFK09_028281 [Dendrobium nobile]